MARWGIGAALMAFQDLSGFSVRLARPERRAGFPEEPDARKARAPMDWSSTGALASVCA
ncbi:hypothetical protein Pmi06nite_30980 [Planotetraspora mira]|uniref:Uncharacterized protein n=1 Tax=Planotetraspora mira TaxID=58121 RepID=A0A8J3TPI6_9ACTN|nr:hypothetical protein Pmi06nite_30980 [Planotetraspora mira]